MPSAQRLTTPVAVDAPEIQGRYAELGDYTVGFESYHHDIDPARYFAGLPGDRCPCDHWGVITTGQITFRWTDRQETYVEGDAYYAPPGHLPLLTAGTSVIEFTRTADLDRTMAVIQQNMTGEAAPA